MKKLFSLFAAVLMAGSLMAEDAALIKFETVQPKTEVAGSTYGSNGFTLVIPAESDKAEVDANKCTFGVSDEDNIQFTHRLKTGGASSKDGRIFTLNIPEEGPLAIYARTSSKDATDRSFLIANGADTIAYHVCLDTDTVEGASSKIFLPVIVENVPAGSYKITYNNGINFYGFQMGVEETEDNPTGPVEGVLDFSAADSASLVWDLPLKDNTLKNDTVDYTDGVNTLTVGAVASGTYYIHNTYNGNDFWALFMGQKGAYVETKVSYDVAKIEVTGCAGASTATIFKVYAGETEIGSHTSSVDAWEVTVPAAHKAAGTVYRVQVANAKNAQIAKIVLVEAVAGAPESPVFSVEGGVYASAQTVELSCVTEGAEIHYTLDGTEPTAASALYTAALTISETTTVKALAVKNGLTSSVVSATYTILTLDGDGTKENPYSLADVVALNNTVSGKAWVKGTIAGYYKDNKFVAGAEEAPASNIGLEAGEVHVPVALPTGAVRTALNLLDNPGNLDKEVLIHGDMVAYFSVPGVKNVDDYEWVIPSSVDNTIEAAKAVKMMVNGQLVIVRDGKTYNAVGAQL